MMTQSTYMVFNLKRKAKETLSIIRTGKYNIDSMDLHNFNRNIVKVVVLGYH